VSVVGWCVHKSLCLENQQIKSQKATAMAAKGNEAQLIARKIIMAKCSKYFEWASWDTDENDVD